jgi:hypothetical protein
VLVRHQMFEQHLMAQYHLIYNIISIRNRAVRYALLSRWRYNI